MIRATQAQAAHFILQKQYLTPAKAANITRLVKELGGLPSPTPATPFLSAYARLVSFDPDSLLASLYQDRTLIKSVLMRNSNYIVTIDDHVTLHAATARQRKQGLNSDFRLWGLASNKEVEGLGEAILAVIGDQPATAQAIAGRLPQNMVREFTQTSRGGRVSTISNVELALRWLVSVGKVGASQEMPLDWRTETLSYAPLNYWYPVLDPSTAPGEAEAQASLVRAYLATFGPATEADISFWTGFGKSETARAVGALSSETTLTMVEGIPGMMLLLKAQANALQATKAPVEPIINVLPADDPITTAYRASRPRYFADLKFQRQVFSSSGAPKPTVLVNGQIVGVWEWFAKEERDKITWQLLTEVDAAPETLIETEVERLGAFIRPGMVVERRV